MARRMSTTTTAWSWSSATASNGIGMLLLGLAIGAGAALLFAPASGDETRERLQREARRAGGA